jgi:hypothetical protein
MTNQGNKGNRDRESNIGQSGNDVNSPAGTSGRGDNWQQGGNEGNRQGGNEGSRQGGDSRKNRSEDDDSPLGNRTTSR